jgi:hypothetical protein
MKIQTFDTKALEIVMTLLTAAMKEASVMQKQALMDQAYSDLYDLVREVNKSGLEDQPKVEERGV